jgi:hypothetical protein
MVKAAENLNSVLQVFFVFNSLIFYRKPHVFAWWCSYSDFLVHIRAVWLTVMSKEMCRQLMLTCKLAILHSTIYYVALDHWLVLIKWWRYDCWVVMVTVSELSAEVQYILVSIHTAQFNACFHTMVPSTGVAQHKPLMLQCPYSMTK